MVRECFTGGKGFFAADAAGTAVIVHCLCTAGSGRFEVDFVGILAVKAVGMPGCGHDFIMADRTELRGGFGGSVTGVCAASSAFSPQSAHACQCPVASLIHPPNVCPLAFPYRSPAILADRLFGAGRRAADVPAVIVAFGTPAVLPGMRFGGADDHAALASFHMGSVVTRVLPGILVPVRVLFPIGLPAFFHSAPAPCSSPRRRYARIRSDRIGTHRSHPDRAARSLPYRSSTSVYRAWFR